MRISDWSSDVCSSDLVAEDRRGRGEAERSSLEALGPWAGQRLREGEQELSFLSCSDVIGAPSAARNRLCLSAPGSAGQGGRQRGGRGRGAGQRPSRALDERGARGCTL